MKLYTVEYHLGDWEFDCAHLILDDTEPLEAQVLRFINADFDEDDPVYGPDAVDAIYEPTLYDLDGRAYEADVRRV